MNKKYFTPLIFLWCYLFTFAQIVNSQIRNEQDREIIQEIKKLGPFLVEGKSLTVVLEVVHLKNTEEFTVASFKITDKDENIHFQKSYNLLLNEYGFQDTYKIEPFIIESSSREALALDYYILPSAPCSGHERQFFIWSEEKLTPFTKPMTVYGKFGALRSGNSKNSYRLLPDDIMIFKEWTGYFFVIIPVRIDLDAKCDSSTLPVKTMSAIDKTTGLSKLEIEVKPFPIKKEHIITLYSAPTGESAEQIIVTPNSHLELGQVYARIIIKENYEIISVIPDNLRLEIKIDGKKGFVEENDFYHLGLSAAG